MHAGGSKQTCRRSRSLAHMEAAEANREGQARLQRKLHMMSVESGQGQRPSRFSPGWMLPDPYKVQSLLPREVESATGNLEYGF